MQIRELDLDSSLSTSSAAQLSGNGSNIDSSDASGINSAGTNDFWHSIAIVHIPAKNPFSYSQVCVYVDGVLKKETDLKCPNLNESFSHIRVGAACTRPYTASSNASSSLAAPLSNLKSVFNLGYKGGATEKVIILKL